MIRFARRIWARARWERQKLSVRAEIRRDDVLAAKSAPPGSILFFAPEAGVSPHLGALCLVARSLAERGHSVVFTRCFRAFQRCPVMDMRRVPLSPSAAVREQTCMQCVSESFSALREFGLHALDLRPFLTRESEEEISSVLAASPADLRDLTYDGIPFGKLSVMNLVLARKVSRLEEATGENRDAWLAYIGDALRAYLAGRELMARARPSAVVYFNDNAMYLGFRIAAERAGVKAFTVAHPPHRNLDRRRIVIAQRPTTLYLHEICRAWIEWAELSLPEAAVRDGGDDLIDRYCAQGSHHYSPARTAFSRELLKNLALDGDRKLLVAYTSSLDEAIATRLVAEGLGAPLAIPPEPFRDQLDWLTSLAAFVEESADLQLVIRVHPREGADRRGGGVSEHLGTLREKLAGSYRHTRIVWPEDEISSYDLAELAHLVLTAWSNIGIELARVGCPVLACAFGVGALPRESFHEWADSRAGYFVKIRELLAREPSLAGVVRSFRWHHYFALARSIDVSDVVPTPTLFEIPPAVTPVNAARFEKAIVSNTDLYELNLATLRAAQEPGAATRELAAVKEQLRRVLRFLVTGQAGGADFRLICVVDPSGDGPPPAGETSVTVRGDEIEWVSEEVRLTKRSVLCARLARMACHTLHGRTAATPREARAAAG